MKKIMGFIKEKKLIIISGFILLFFILGGLFIIDIYKNRYQNINNKYQNEVKLTNALQSEMDSVYNNNDELLLEKNTLEGDISRLKELKKDLSDNQKQLLNEIESLNKKNKLLAAANMKMELKIDSLDSITSVGIVDTTKKQITFKRDDKDIEYEFLVSNAVPFDSLKRVTHNIKKIKLPNTQYIQFHYEDKQNNPVSFSVKNSNSYMEVHDIDSYIIPEIDIEDMDVGTFEKMWLWYQKQSTFVKTGVGVVIGGGTVYMLK